MLVMNGTFYLNAGGRGAQQWRNQFTPYLTLPELTARGLVSQDIKAGSLIEGNLRYLSIFSFSQCCGSAFIEFVSGFSI